MDMLMKIMGNPWIAFPLVGLSVGTIVFMWFDNLFGRVVGSAATNIDEIMRILDLMHVQTERKKVVIIQYLASLGVGFAFFLLLWPRATIGLLVGGAIGFFMWRVPLMVVRRQWEQRNSKIVDQMVDGLTMMANGISAGLTAQQSMERVANNMPNPLSQEFYLVLSQMRVGSTLEEALIEFGARVPKQDVQMFVTAINILKETGGNMGETFTTIVQTIRERQKVERKIEAMTAQGIMQGFIVSLVPLGLIGLFYVIDPGYITPMFNSTLGIILLLAMFGLIIAGGVAIRKVVTIKV